MVANPSGSTRKRIVDAASDLFYARGYSATSFGDIAAAVGLSRGNFYHHFQTKDAILAAVIDHRSDNIQAMLDQWALDHPDPLGRLQSFARILVVNHAEIVAHGCPVGTLCNELAKLHHPAHPDAVTLFTRFRVWLSAQFSSLGLAPQADALALHLLMRSQGIATLATAYRDQAFVERELAAIERWLATLVQAGIEREAPCT